MLQKMEYFTLQSNSEESRINLNIKVTGSNTHYIKWYFWTMHPSISNISAFGYSATKKPLDQFLDNSIEKETAK